MARIVDFAIAGLGGRERLVAKTLHPHLNVFFGKNGGGKTTLLRTLNSALSNETLLVTDSPIKDAAVTIFSVDYDREFKRNLVRSSAEETSTAGQLNLSLQGSVDNPKASKMLSSEWTTLPLVSGADARFRSVFLPVSRLYQAALSQGFGRTWGGNGEYHASTAEPSLEAMFAGQFNQMWALFSNGLLAEIKDIQQDGIGRMLQDVLLSDLGADQAVHGDPEKAYDLAKSFFDRQPLMSSLVQSKSEFLRHYSRNAALRAVMRTIESTEMQIRDAQEQRNNLERLVNRLFNGKVVSLKERGIEVKTDEGNPLTLAQLSTGEKQVLSLCVSVLGAGVQGTILIDEPEMSLHIDWQQELLEILLLLNPSSQLIVATHSPEIMANIDEEHIFRI